MEPIITLENLSKTYDGKCVIDHISHEFYKGESIAFTGHNGCGKSTMLKLLAGLISTSSGKVKYHKKLRFAFVPEKFPGMDIKMVDYLYTTSKMESVESSVVDQLIKDFFLESMSNTKMSELSKGSLQKVGVIQALLVPADVLLLDEPLSGQDAASQEVFIKKCNALRKKGVTIFMSCHEKKLIDELSDKEYTIADGKLCAVESDKDTFYKIYIRKNANLTPWESMEDHGNRYLINVDQDMLKETVLKLYDEEWELAGIEEYI